MILLYYWSALCYIFVMRFIVLLSCYMLCYSILYWYINVIYPAIHIADCSGWHHCGHGCNRIKPAYGHRARATVAGLALSAPALKKGIRHCACPTACHDYNWGPRVQPFRLNRCKAPGSIFASRGGKNLHPIFRLAGDKKLLDICYFRAGGPAPPPGS